MKRTITDGRPHPERRSRTGLARRRHLFMEPGSHFVYSPSHVQLPVIGFLRREADKILGCWHAVGDQVPPAVTHVPDEETGFLGGDRRLMIFK